MEDGIEEFDTDLLIKTAVDSYYAKGHALGEHFFMATPIRLVERSAHAPLARTDFSNIPYVVEFRQMHLRCLINKRRESKGAVNG